MIREAMWQSTGSYGDETWIWFHEPYNMQNNEPKKNLVNKILLTIKKCDCLMKKDHNASPVAIFFNSYVLAGRGFSDSNYKKQTFYNFFQRE